VLVIEENKQTRGKKRGKRYTQNAFEIGDHLLPSKGRERSGEKGMGKHKGGQERCGCGRGPRKTPGPKTGPHHRGVQQERGVRGAKRPTTAVDVQKTRADGVRILGAPAERRGTVAA